MCFHVLSPLESEVSCGSLSPRTCVGGWSVLGWAGCPGNPLPSLSSEAKAGTAGLGGPPAGPNSSLSLSGAQLAFDATAQGVCPSILSCAGHRGHTQPALEVSDVPHHLHSNALLKLLPSGGQAGPPLHVSSKHPHLEVTGTAPLTE